MLAVGLASTGYVLYNTIAQVTTHALDAAQCAVEDELLALNRRAGVLESLASLVLLPPIYEDALTYFVR